MNRKGWIHYFTKLHLLSVDGYLDVKDERGRGRERKEVVPDCASSIQGLLLGIDTAIALPHTSTAALLSCFSCQPVRLLTTTTSRLCCLIRGTIDQLESNEARSPL